MNDSTNPDPDGIGARLDEHYFTKLKEAQLKFGKQRATQLAQIVKLVMASAGQLNLSREEVRFIQDWIDEAGEIVKPTNRIITPDQE